jgi:DNA-binding CsgD family transcriptional regulator
VNQGLAEGIHGPTRRAFRALAERYPHYENSNESSALSSLTEREREILNDWMAQARPKATAERIGISAAAVYNLRSQIRRKLRVPEGEDVPSWLKRTDPSNH